MLKTWSPNVLSTRFFMFFLSCSSSSLQSTSTSTSQPTSARPPSGLATAPSKSSPERAPHRADKTRAAPKLPAPTCLECAPDQNRRQPQPPPTRASADRGKNHRGFQGASKPRSFTVAGFRERQALPYTPPIFFSSSAHTSARGAHQRLAVETRRTGNAPPGRSAETTCESPTD